MFRRSLVLLAAFTLSASAFAADEQTEAAVDTRQGLLKTVGFYMGPMVGMARQQIPFDAERMQYNAERIAELAPMIPDVFRRDTRGADVTTEARDGIWENTEDFADKAATVAARAADLAAATGDGQGAAMKAFGAMGAACKACHDEYRQQE